AGSGDAPAARRRRSSPEPRGPRASARARPLHGAAHGALFPGDLRRRGPVSLHRVDPRFVLPHRVRRAVVLDGLEEWRAGLVSAGIDVSDEWSDRGPPDLVVSPVRLAAEARYLKARSIIVEGSRQRPFRGGSYQARRVLLRPTRDRPTLALPLDQPAPVSYALERWSVVD